MRSLGKGQQCLPMSHHVQSGSLEHQPQVTLLGSIAAKDDVPSGSAIPAALRNSPACETRE